MDPRGRSPLRVEREDEEVEEEEEAPALSEATLCALDDVLRRRERVTAADPRLALRLLAEAEVQADTIASLRDEVRRLRARGAELERALAYEQAQRSALELAFVQLRDKGGLAPVDEEAGRHLDEEEEDEDNDVDDDDDSDDDDDDSEERLYATVGPGGSDDGGEEEEEDGHVYGADDVISTSTSEDEAENAHAASRVRLGTQFFDDDDSDGSSGVEDVATSSESEGASEAGGRPVSGAPSAASLSSSAVSSLSRPAAQGTAPAALAGGGARLDAEEARELASALGDSDDD